MEFGKNRKGRNADNVMYGVDSDALKPEYESAGKKTLPITSKIKDDDDIINKMTRDIEEQYKEQEKPTDGLQDSNYDSIDRA
jgi:basic membrane lipoprotein Med (substrate-binding protein (PBP1-ABC) superfamily)